MTRLLIVLAALLFACNADPRRASIIVEDPALDFAVHKAAALWHEATAGEVDFSFVDSCESDPGCIYIGTAERFPGDRGHTHSCRGEVAVIRIHEMFFRDVGLVTHELGHALWLDHVQSRDEALHRDSLSACIGPETLREYRFRYGACLGCAPACASREVPA